jgi:hypothetical protein
LANNLKNKNQKKNGESNITTIPGIALSKISGGQIKGWNKMEEPVSSFRAQAQTGRKKMDTTYVQISNVVFDNDFTTSTTHAEN